MIRKARKEKGWSQVDLAERADRLPFTVSSSTVSNWETERVRPGIDEANWLIRVLTLSSEEFYMALGADLTPPRAARLPRTLLDALLSLPAEEYPQIEHTAHALLALRRLEGRQ